MFDTLRTQASIRANGVALACHYIDGTLLAEITPHACRSLGAREGLDAYCLIKIPH
jgi:hypothetical protein